MKTLGRSRSLGIKRTGYYKKSNRMALGAVIAVTSSTFPGWKTERILSHCIFLIPKNIQNIRTLPGLFSFEFQTI